MKDCRFAQRKCPLCRSDSRTRLVAVPASRFCAVNSTYRSDYAAVLNIAPDTEFWIARCSGCGFVYAELEPSAEFLAKVYDEVILHEANRSLNESAAGQAARMRDLACLLDLAPKGVSLTAFDYGCGLGISMRLLEAAGVRCVGMELSGVRSGYVASAGGAVVRTSAELRARGPFGLLICDNVLEHLADPVGAVGFLASVADRGAVLFAGVPDYNDQFLAEQAEMVRMGGLPDMSFNPWEHLNYFDLAQLDRLLAGAGFLPIPESGFSGDVHIGLRRDAGFAARLGNACVSGLRLARYALTGEAVRNPNRAFYRFSG